MQWHHGDFNYRYCRLIETKTGEERKRKGEKRREEERRGEKRREEEREPSEGVS